MYHSDVALFLQGAQDVHSAWQGSDTSNNEAIDTAVIAALSFWDYAFVASTPGSDAYKATGRCISVAAGRISYTFGYKGSSINLVV